MIVDRMNPFQAMNDVEFLMRFRLSKDCVTNLIDTIQGQLPIAPDERGNKHVLFPLQSEFMGSQRLSTVPRHFH